jgi:hypothetical protein
MGPRDDSLIEIPKSIMMGMVKIMRTVANTFSQIFLTYKLYKLAFNELNDTMGNP